MKIITFVWTYLTQSFPAHAVCLGDVTVKELALKVKKQYNLLLVPGIEIINTDRL